MTCSIVSTASPAIGFLVVGRLLLALFPVVSLINLNRSRILAGVHGSLDRPPGGITRVTIRITRTAGREARGGTGE